MSVLQKQSAEGAQLQTPSSLTTLTTATAVAVNRETTLKRCWHSLRRVGRDLFWGGGKRKTAKLCQQTGIKSILRSCDLLLVAHTPSLCRLHSATCSALGTHGPQQCPEPRAPSSMLIFPRAKSKMNGDEWLSYSSFPHQTFRK